MQAHGKSLNPLQDGSQLTRCRPPHSGSATTCVLGGRVWCRHPLSSLIEGEFLYHLLLPDGLPVGLAGLHSRLLLLPSRLFRRRCRWGNLFFGYCFQSSHCRTVRWEQRSVQHEFHMIILLCLFVPSNYFVCNHNKCSNFYSEQGIGHTAVQHNIQCFCSNKTTSPHLSGQ